uniref:SP-RING-type domain-containing protein n=2 Tax=Mesocestoides corti TaxID=53468 RepID=A0A5K3EXF0_MESCO
MALHAGAIGGLGIGRQITNCNITGGPTSALETQASPMAAVSLSAPTTGPTANSFVKYASSYCPGDPYANGGGLASYPHAAAPEGHAPPPMTQMMQPPPPPQQFASQPQRIVQTSLIDAGYYMQPCWATAPTPTPPPHNMVAQQTPFEESLPSNGTSGGAASARSTPNGAPPPTGRRLITPPMASASAATAAAPGSLYAPRFASPAGQIFHSPNAAVCIPQPSPTAYMPMHAHPHPHHDPACLGPAFAGAAAAVNGQRIFFSQTPARLPGGTTPLRAAPIGYFPLADGSICASPVPFPPPGTLEPGEVTSSTSLPPTGGGGGGRKSETAKKKRAKTTKAQSRANAIRGANNRATNVASSAPKVVTVGPSVPPSGLTSPMMAPGMMLSTAPGGVGAPMWGPGAPRMGAPPGGLMNNGGMLPTTCGVPPKAIPDQMGTVHPSGAGPQAPHQSAPPAPQSSQPCTAVYVPTQPNRPDPLSERLVCPITNGTVVQPMVLHLDEEQARQSPGSLQIRSCDFELSKNHLSTIVERPDLDIVVCSHLANEPLQMCHWPDEAVNIRFNGTALPLDRSSAADGQPAHKVCGVKSLCRPGRNTLEIILSPACNSASRATQQFQNGTGLKDHRFAVFMAHMPALSMVLDGLQRRMSDDAVPLTHLLITSWRTRHQQQTGDQRPATPSQPIIAEISLVCPVFRTRMQVPGRIAGCKHMEAFDMEAFLHREALWPRLLCPICGNGSLGGVENLYIDTILSNIIQLTPKTALSVQVRSDGFWRLPPPLAWQLPPGTDQWQAMVGPPTQAFALALQTSPTVVMTTPPSHTNGFDAPGVTPAKRSCGTMASPSSVSAPFFVYTSTGMDSNTSSNCPLHTVATSGQWNSDNMSSNNHSPVPQGVTSPSTNPTPASTRQIQTPDSRKRVLSSGNCNNVSNSHATMQSHQTNHCLLPSSEPDLRAQMEGNCAAAPPKSFPPTPTFVKPSPPTPVLVNFGGSLCNNNNNNRPSPTSAAPQPKCCRNFRGKLTDADVRWAFDGLTGLDVFNQDDYRQFVSNL